MSRKLLSLFVLFLVVSCGVVKKKTSYGKERKVSVAASSEKPENTSVTEETVVAEKKEISPKKAENIISTAMSYSGVRYKYGGTSRKGMDCSGLLYVAFGQHNVVLPRISYHMANEGKRIKVNNVSKGDLLFFKTSKRGKKINHVGLVVAVENDEIKFIHSTSSRGVIVSSLREGFWNYAFVKATRVL
ncbi:C40 family peptidase [Muriicola sp. Z0-33]|uniref:C40 family peptidase n=1 Tax=Muriicola sp. Z0-33 TaxID=2816957 RepID=UPI002237E378|nr:C40 family peptidase [Muriicola sp. Z0-33]MCW5515142.1 C40 family peptidase [Muriicola sp. Z0-33]